VYKDCPVLDSVFGLSAQEKNALAVSAKDFVNENYSIFTINDAYVEFTALADANGKGRDQPAQ
jgi:hypothetical protein